MPTPSSRWSADPDAAPDAAPADPVDARAADRPLRVAAYSAVPAWAEDPTLVDTLAGLDARGHAVRLYCNDRATKARAVEAGVLARWQELGPAFALHHAVRFARELRRRAPDLLILDTARKLRLGALAARRAGVPLVVRARGEDDLPRGVLRRRLFERRVDAVAFEGEGLRDAFLHAVPGFTGATATILPGVRPIETRGGVSFRAMIGVPLDAALIGSIAPLTRPERHEKLIEVLARLPEAHAVIVGAGPRLRTLRRVAEEAAVAGRLHFTGPGEDLSAALDAMDLFVVTRTSASAQVSMLGALAAGVPAVGPIALDAGDDDPAAWLATSPDASAIAAAVAGLLEDRTLRTAMGETARTVARRRFAVDRMVAKWDAFLAGLGSAAS